MLERKLSAQMVAPTEIEAIAKTVTATAAMVPAQAPTPTPEPQQIEPVDVATVPDEPMSEAESFEATIAAIRAASKKARKAEADAALDRSEQASLDDTPASAPTGQLIVSGRDADGNRVVFSREITDEADREDIMQSIVQGTLRSQIIGQTE
jgi:hypothetical protein